MSNSVVSNRSDFAIVVPSFLDDYGLNPQEYRLYGHIVRRAGKDGCFESIPNMATICLMNEKTVRKTLQILIAARFIKIAQERKGKTTIYEITHHSQWMSSKHLEKIRQQITGGKSGSTKLGGGSNTKSGRGVVPNQAGVVVPEMVGVPLPEMVDEGITIKELPIKDLPLRDLSLNPSQTDTGSQERKEKREFGFQVQEEPNSSFSTLLPKKSETTQPTSQSLMKANVPPPLPDPFLKNQRKKPNDVIWDWLPDGPWCNEEGKLDAEFQTALATRWMKEYGGDLHANKAKVLKHFRNEPTNLAIEWEWYQSTFIHRVVNIQTRKQNGLDTTQDEEQIALQARAAIPLPESVRVTQTPTLTKMVEQVADYALPTLISQEPPKDEFGCINPGAYLNTPKQSDREFWANFTPHAVPSRKKSLVTSVLETAKPAIEALKVEKVEQLNEKAPVREAEEKIKGWGDIASHTTPANSSLPLASSKNLTAIAAIVQPPVIEEEAVLQDMRKYLNCGSDVLRQTAIDWACDPANQCELVIVSGRVVDIKWVDF